jgi:hypothetical protein
MRLGWEEGGFDKALDDFDSQSWEALKEKGLEDLHICASSLLDGFLKSTLRLQVLEKGGADVYRIFDNEGRDLSAIENGLKLKLALLQVENPPAEQPEEDKPVKPSNLIDKRPITDHPEDTKGKRDAMERTKMEKPVEEKKKENGG